MDKFEDAGAEPKAVSKAPDRAWLRHEVPSWVVGNPVFFVTICCESRGGNVLCQPEVGELLIGSVASYNERQRWFARIWLLMPDHVHALVSVPVDSSLKKTLADWKRFTSRQTGIRWQDGFFEHRIRASESLDEKEQYIRRNPERAGLVESLSEWPWVYSGFSGSSAQE